TLAAAPRPTTHECRLRSSLFALYPFGTGFGAKPQLRLEAAASFRAACRTARRRHTNAASGGSHTAAPAPDKESELLLERHHRLLKRSVSEIDVDVPRADGSTLRGEIVDVLAARWVVAERIPCIGGGGFRRAGGI